MGQILYPLRGADLRDAAARLRTDDGRDGLGDERGRRHHQHEGEAQDRARLCGRKDHAPLFRARPRLHPHPAPLPDGGWYLRYFHEMGI